MTTVAEFVARGYQKQAEDLKSASAPRALIASVETLASDPISRVSNLRKCADWQMVKVIRYGKNTARKPVIEIETDHGRLIFHPSGQHYGPHIEKPDGWNTSL